MTRPLSYYLIHPLQQWISGLLDCLPVGLRSRLVPRVEPYVFELSDSQARIYHRHDGTERQLGILDAHDSHVDAGLVSLLKNRQVPLLMLLPSAWVLRRQITLPAAAMENLGQVIKFEMDRLTPFTADQVYYDYHFEQRSAEDELIPVSVALVPRNKLQFWLSLLADASIRLDKICAEELWPGANLLPLKARPVVSMKRAALKALPAMVVVVLLLAAMALPLWQKRNVAIAMQKREVPLKKQANQVVRIRDQLQAERERQQQLYSSWTRYPPAVDVLTVLNDLLPDDTSLQQMDIKQSQLIIRGTSSQASSLIGLLESATGFSEVKFMSSVVQQRGKEQFHLSANIVMPFMQTEVTDTTGSSTADTSVAPTPPASSDRLPAVTESVAAPLQTTAAVGQASVASQPQPTSNPSDSVPAANSMLPAQPTNITAASADGGSVGTSAVHPGRLISGAGG